VLRSLLTVLLLVATSCRTAPPAAEPRVAVPVVTAVDSTGLAPVTADSGMVVSGHPEASRVGVEVLRAGGNAVDAAVATAFALAVTLPYSGNVGGGGFIVIRFPDGQATTIDFREVAPLAATRDMYLDEQGRPQRRLATIGHLAAGVPASPAGLLMALERYGSLDLAGVLDPAIRLAEEGFPLTSRQAARFNRYRSQFEAFPSTVRYFVKADGSDFFPEERFVQTDLGAVLRRIRDEGRDGFYRGITAALIVAEMQRGGGIITHEDLARYEPVERPPLEGTYRSHRVITMPPPSGGGITLLQLLNAVEPVDYGGYGFQSVAAVHKMGEAMRRAFADRAAWSGDPDFVEVPTSALISKSYMWDRMRSFDPARVTPSEAVRAGDPVNRVRDGSTETTHLSVVDASGMAVSLTTTVNDWYGSKVVVDGAGFFLNNIMDDFNTAPGEPDIWGGVTFEQNVIEPGKRMLSSMTPTIVEDPHGRAFLVLGTPGGTTIPTTVAQIVTSIVDFGLDLPTAVEAPRFHHQWTPDRLQYEAGFSEALADSLEAMGWSTARRSGTSGMIAGIKVLYEGDRRTLVGAFDPRRDGTPVGF
jgi:gamma-glutamyltranspeptidase / glutathione hydrolase